MSRKGSNKQWMHPPEALLRGHIVYYVKFLGHVEVDTPKGSDVVKDAIRKMKFTKQIRKAEGQKPPKVELTISIDGLTILDAKSKSMQHQYPLHRISYCADDKADKRMFTFIAKEADKDLHHCFVFDSEKCAEEITLTVGQAFDLAYRRFLESSSKDMDMKKQHLLLQKKVQQLTQENLALKARVALLERLVDPKTVQEQEKRQEPPRDLQVASRLNLALQMKRERKISSPIPYSLSPPPAQSSLRKERSKSMDQPVVGRKLENLVMDSSPHTNGNHSLSPVPALAPPPPVPARSNIASPVAADKSVTNNTPVAAVPRRASTGVKPAVDPFGMPAFSPMQSSNSQDFDQQIRNVDKELMDLETGFSQGLSFGTADFSLEDLDPLNHK